MAFPIDLKSYKPVKLDLGKPLSKEQLSQLKDNIQLCRDAIIFFTAHAGARGLGGHTGGAYDIVPEVLIAEGFMQSGKILPVHYDEAGHRVAIQYLMSVLRGLLPAEQLLKYREFKGKLPGHPEQDLTPGVDFSSGRLGHLWPYVNGVSISNPGKAVVLYGSDGSQQEGDDAEAARFAVANDLDVKLFIDDNDVTIAGHPSEYMKGYDVAKTLEAHGLNVLSGDGEDIEGLYERMQAAFREKGPVAVISKRKMAPHVPNIEGTPKGHDVIDSDSAIAYLEKRNLSSAVDMVKSAEKVKFSYKYKGSSKEKRKNREEFGKIVSGLIGRIPKKDRKGKILVIDSDLEGSQGLHHIHKEHPEVYISGGIMERGNFSAAAGFGSKKGSQGIFSTFSAFLEMVVSEITMARLNDSNVLAHFSHAGVDDMADNTCHFGINNFFAHNGLQEGDKTRLYFPADANQMKAVLESTFDQEGLRFVFSTRSGVPDILQEDGSPYYADGYRFEPGKDEVIREGRAGYIVSYGEMLYRCLDAVERLKEKGILIGLINKPTLNLADPDMMKKLAGSRFVLVVESQNRETGLGSRFGSWLLEAGFNGKYGHMGAVRPGEGGLGDQIPFQGLSPENILEAAESLSK